MDNWAEFVSKSAHSIGVGVIRGLGNFIAILWVASLLGATDFGVYIFSISIFLPFLKFFDFYISNAFFNYASRSSKDCLGAFHLVFGYSVAVFFILYFALVYLDDSWLSILAPDINREVLFFGLVLAFLQSRVFNLLDQVLIALHRNELRLLLTIVYMSIYFLTLYLFQIYENYSLYYFLGAGIGAWAIATLIIYLLIFVKAERLSVTDARDFYLSTVRFIKPLIPASFLILLVGFFDQWFVAKYGDLASRGVMGLAQRYVGAVGLPVSFIVLIYWNNVVRTYASGDLRLLQKTLNKLLRYMMCLSMAIGLSASFYSDLLLVTLLGEGFLQLSIVMWILLTYLVSFPFVQLVTTALTGMGDSLSIAKVTFRVLITSLVLTVLLIPPSDLLGYSLGLGVIGWAFKMALLGLLESVFSWREIQKYLALEWKILLVWICSVASFLYAAKIIASFFGSGFLELSAYVIIVSFVGITFIIVLLNKSAADS